MLNLFLPCTLLLVGFGVAWQPHVKPKAPVKRPKSESYLFTAAGFTKEGTPVTASGQRTGKVEIVVRDAATGKPTYCRMNVVGPDGNFYKPKPNYLSEYAMT